MIMLKTGMILTSVLICAFSLAEGAGPIAVRAPDQEVSDARRRHQQLPLPVGEALVMAEMAREIGDFRAEAEFLERAIASPVYGELARVKLAETLVETDAERAVELVLPTLQLAGTNELRKSAVNIARLSVLGGISADLQDSLEQAARKLPRSNRRTIDAVSADPEGAAGRSALGQLLERDQSDLAALYSARRLQTLKDLSRRERWLVARCLYRHALFREAAPILEDLAASGSKDVPSSDVNFMRGRCGFRLDQWAEAELWYLRALKLAPSRTRKAEIQVHLARTRELAGNLEGATEMARQAVVTTTSDDRRLFLVRLRLRQGRRDLAEVGIVNIRKASAKARGWLLMGLDDLAAGRTENALSMLDKVRARPWRGPARVVAAGELVRIGRVSDAIVLLERAADELNPFWGEQARRIMATLPSQVLAEWRMRQEASVEAAGAVVGHSLRRWAVLEIDTDALDDIQKRIAAIRGVSPVTAEPAVGGLAGDLRSIGLHRIAVRWDPREFPVASPEEGLWSAHQFLVGGSPWLAIRTTDAVWRKWGADVPVRGYPDDLMETLYPLPGLREVRTAAEAGGIAWEIVAGVAREESRWNPEVLSRVGARGLMQLMPLTAEAVAGRLGVPAPSPEQLFQPQWSLKLGASELGRLSQSFDNFNPAAVAAYNAGEAQSRLWLEQCGAGCTESRFVLTITFEATRGYTGDVMASAEIYSRLQPQSSESHQ